MQVKYKTGDFGHLSVGPGILEVFQGYCDTIISIVGVLAVFAPHYLPCSPLGKTCLNGKRLFIECQFVQQQNGTEN